MDFEPEEIVVAKAVELSEYGFDLVVDSLHSPVGHSVVEYENNPSA